MSFRSSAAACEVRFAADRGFGLRFGVVGAVATFKGCRSWASAILGDRGDVLPSFDCFECAEALRIEGDLALGGVFSSRMRSELGGGDGKEMHDPAEETVGGER